MGTDSGPEWAAERLPWPVGAGMADPGLALGQLVERAAWSGFDSWWSKVAGVGFCARPIHLVGVDLTGREHAVLARCKNRRAGVCPSCSDLYAADTWQLVTAGVVGGRHGMPNTGGVASGGVCHLDGSLVRPGARGAGRGVWWGAALSATRAGSFYSELSAMCSW